MDLSGAARRVVNAPKEGLSTVLEAPQQVGQRWQEVTTLLRRTGRLLDRAELIVARLEHRLDELDTLTDATSQLVVRAGEVADHTDTVAQEARSTRQRAEEQVTRLQGLLDTYEPLLRSVAPLGGEMAASLKPEHVRSVVSLLDEMPHLVGLLRPALDNMGGLLPHLEGVTDRMDNVGQVVEGLPGAKTLRRRGQARDRESD